MFGVMWFKRVRFTVGNLWIAIDILILVLWCFLSSTFGVADTSVRVSVDGALEDDGLYRQRVVRLQRNPDMLSVARIGRLWFPKEPLDCDVDGEWCLSLGAMSAVVPLLGIRG